MTKAEIKSVRDAVPFKSFTIRLSDGGIANIPHPEYLAIHPKASLIIALNPAGGFSVIEPQHVVALDFSSTSRAKVG